MVKDAGMGANFIPKIHIHLSILQNSGLGFDK